MSPHWTGSPQHVVAGILLALVTYLVVRRRLPVLWCLAASLVVTMAAEAVVELAEYPLLYGEDATSRAYYDTVADIGATLVGAVIGAVLGLVIVRLRPMELRGS